MRRTLTVVLLTLLALPLCAQHRSSSSHSSGSVAFHSSPSGFGSRGAVGFRSGPVISSGIGFRGGSGIGFRRGVSIGHNPRFNVFVGSGRFNQPRRWSVYPYRSSYSYVYPYVVYPAYPMSYYDAYDYVSVPAQPAYVYDYASGGDNYPADVGLAEQMRQQNVGIYRRQLYPTDPSAVTPAQPAPAPEPDRPPTVLVYRDGQRTEIRNYAVVGQTLWIFFEDRAQKVPLAQLDLDATRKANDDRGIEFPVPPKP